VGGGSGDQACEFSSHEVELRLPPRLLDIAQPVDGDVVRERRARVCGEGGDDEAGEQKREG